MKCMFLGSLVSCMLVGQSFGHDIAQRQTHTVTDDFNKELFVVGLLTGLGGAAAYPVSNLLKKGYYDQIAFGKDISKSSMAMMVGSVPLGYSMSLLCSDNSSIEKVTIRASFGLGSFLGSIIGGATCLVCGIAYSVYKGKF